MNGPLFILSGPSGSGKTTVLDRLLADKRWPLHLSVSVTTRSPRPGEIDGKHYKFWTREQFERELAAGGFLEWADVFGAGHRYGTLKSEVEPYRERGEGVVLEIDVNGRQQVIQQCPDAVSIFLRGSSLQVYEQRLRSRGTESEPAIQKRLAAAKAELERAHTYDHQVINDSLDSAVTELKEIVRKEFEKRSRQ